MAGTILLNSIPDTSTEYTIGFDMDGVLADIHPTMQEHVANYMNTSVDKIRMYDRHLGYELFSYCWPEGYDRGNVVEAVNDYLINRSVTEAPPTPFMREVLMYVTLNLDQEILIITHRPAVAMEATVLWLNEHLNNDVDYTCIMATQVEKSELIMDLDLKMFVDDRFRIIADLAYVVEKPFLFNRSYNSGRVAPYPVQRLTDLRDLIPFINIEAGRRPAAWPWWIKDRPGC